MTLGLNGQNDIIRLGGQVPDEVVATKAKPSLTAEEVAYLAALPPQSKLKQAYLASTAKTELQAYQVAATQALVSEARISTWANRANVLAAGLTTAFFTDVGIGGSYWDYLGGRWRPQARFVTLKNLTGSITQTTNTRAVMDFCTLPAGLWQDGDILECRWYKAMTTGTDTDTTESAIGTGSGTFGTSLGLSTAALTNTNPVLSAIWRWRRVSNTIIRHASIGGSTGLGSAGALLNDITASVPDMDGITTYAQLSGVLTTGAGAVSALRACTWTIYTGA